MLKQVQNIILSIFIFSFSLSFSQDMRKQTNDTLDTDVVNVVKPYTPKISDAFKIKEIPSLDDETTATKKEIKYNIFSIPVASTFTPSKGKAAQVDKAKKEKLYDNYASLGFGTYTSILGEVYLNHALSRTENVGGYVSHHSSQGGIDGVVLDDKFSDSKIRLNYASNLRDMSWNVDAGYQHEVYNWYGISPVHTDAAMLDDINPQHKYFTFDFGGEIEFDKSLFNKARARFTRFADDYDSAENRFEAITNINIPIGGEEVKTDIKIDYLGGTFDNDYFGFDKIKYGNFQVGLSPNYQIKEDDLTVNLGFSAYYLNDTEASENKFFIYPKITASYRLVDEVLITYAGIEGDLIQNSYRDLASLNPFMSPTLFIVPTDQQYNAYIGLKGKLSSNMSYNIRGNYYAESNKALIKNNTFLNFSNQENYSYGNSFKVVYDDITTFSLFGELNVDINRNFNLGIKAEYFSYTMDEEEKAWNLPDFEASLFMDYQIDEHWFAGANLYYTGERSAQSTLEGALLPTDLTTNYTLESYFDANAHVGYRINEQFSVYAKANNIANQDYQKWLNYPVQGIQFLAGVTYKFDF